MVLAHVIVGDRLIAEAAAHVVYGAPTVFDNFASQCDAYLQSVVDATGGWVVPVLSARPDVGSDGFAFLCMPFLGCATLHDLLDRAYPAKESGPPARAAVILEAARSRGRPDDPPRLPGVLRSDAGPWGEDARTVRGQGMLRRLPSVDGTPCERSVPEPGGGCDRRSTGTRICYRGAAGNSDLTQTRSGW